MAETHPGLTSELQPIKWDVHAREILASHDAKDRINERRELAIQHGLAAVFFTGVELAGEVQKYAQHEVVRGRANRAKYVDVRNGGTPFHTDLVAAMEAIGRFSVKVDHIRTTAYDGPHYVGAHVVEDPNELPETLEPGDEVVFVDDGIETAGSLIVSGEFITERYGVTDISALTALTKQPGMVIAEFRDTSSMFTTPFGVWGEGNGFDDNGHNRDTRVVGMSMTQSPNNYDIVEFALDTLGGTDGIAVATIDDIIRYNQK